MHAAYVSDYPGRNEVYYKRFDLALNVQAQSCASDTAAPGATQPCACRLGSSFGAVSSLTLALLGMIGVSFGFEKTLSSRGQVWYKGW